MNEPAQNLIVPEERVEKSGRQVIELDSATPVELLRIAVSQGADLAKIEKLMELQERWEANQARKAFGVAMAEFKKTAPAIVKDTHVHFTNKAGTVTEYDHASLFAVCQAIISGLANVGISHRWVPKQANNRIEITCVLTHVAGHSESTTMDSGPDDSGGKNAIQAIGSAKSYLERYTLLAATGLATKEQDDDGRGTDVEYISDQQVADLRALGEEVGADREKFLRTIKCRSLEEIPVAAYSVVVGLLEARRGRTGTDVAHKMRALMNQDKDEMQIAQEIEDENERLNRSNQTAMEEAWTILSTAERTTWKGWLTWRKDHERK